MLLAATGFTDTGKPLEYQQPSRGRARKNNWKKGQRTIEAKRRRLYENQGPSQHSMDRIARRMD